jgi:hypothetical protein
LEAVLLLEIMPLYGRRAFEEADDREIEQVFLAWQGRRIAQYEEKRAEREWWARLFGAEIQSSPSLSPSSGTGTGTGSGAPPAPKTPGTRMTTPRKPRPHTS